MNLALYYYRYSVYGNFQSGLSMAFTILWGVVLLSVISIFISIAEDLEKVTKGSIKFLKMSIVGILLLTIPMLLMPLKKDVAIIVGLKFSEKGIERVIDDASEFYPLLKTIIKNELKELAGGENAKN